MEASSNPITAFYSPEFTNTASLSSGLHHARPGSGEGYCTVNGLAVAVRAALARGAGRVLVLYNAGVDPHEDAGGLPGITTATIERREQLVFDWAAAAGVPVAFTLAGGYRSGRLDLDGVAALHLLTFRAASRAAGRPVD
jgi:acetoin utilization deacetylase AcuC-like enzyme